MNRNSLYITDSRASLLLVFLKKVYYNGLADHALVSFAQNAEAAAAFHSSKPIFNNRFVSVSWHSAAKQVILSFRIVSFFQYM